VTTLSSAAQRTFVAALLRVTGTVACISVVAVASCRSLGGGGRVDPNVPAPDSFVVRFETSRGPVDVLARKSWAPNGADRFYTLVQNRYYDEARFYRVVKGFVAQFGLAATPAVTAAWRARAIADEPVKHSNTRGTISYARGGPGTRTTQLFFNLVDNARLDTTNTFGFPPIGEVVAGMSAVDSLYSGYGNAAPRTGATATASGPQQDSITRQGNDYLKRGWPKLDYVKTARVITEWRE
jgi:peptidyl-prolyl cis-trans isomerase A (cyclophilin A)